LKRLEIAMGSIVPPPGARLVVRSDQGTFDLAYVVGRWRE
jgi:hypothetical protein